MTDGDTVRYAHLDDIADLAVLHVAAWRVAYRGILSDEALDLLSVKELEAVWRVTLARTDRTNLVVVREGRVGGFVGFGAGPDSTDNEIYGIYVHPDHWRAGLGRVLMTAALECLRREDSRRVTLWVMEENRAARRFYQATGFSLTGSRRISERYGCRFSELEYRLEI